MNVPATIVHTLLRRAVERIGRDAEVTEYTSIDGSYLLVEGVVLVDVLQPTDDPYDEFARDRVRVVAARLHVPAIALVTLRSVVSYRTDAVVKRLPEEQQIIGTYGGVDITTSTELTADDHDRLGMALQTMLTDIYVQRAPVEAEELLGERVREAATTMLSCTDRSTEQNERVVRVVTSVLAYALLQMRREEDLDRLSIPWGIRSATLMLDVLGSYFREARRKGFMMFPEHVDDIDVLDQRSGLFRTALASLCTFLHRIDPRRIDDHALHRTVDDVVRWCDGARRAPSPTIDVVDVALRLAAPAGASRLLEVGDAGGLFAVRARMLAESRGQTPPDVYVFAPTTDAERAVVLRTSGRVDAAADIGLVRRHMTLERPWDVLCAAGTTLDGRHLLRLLADKLPMSANGAMVMVLPLAVLYADHYAAVRTSLTQRFCIRWVLTSDAESLVSPEAGTCCIVATRHADDEDEAPARIVVLRKPLSAFFMTCDAPRELDAKRTQHLDAFIGYIGASQRGKNNDEVYVRTVTQRAMRERADGSSGTWFDLLVPPDVVSRILTKTSSRMQLLRDLGQAWSGLRTGANEFFVVDTETIATEGLEAHAWQRTGMDGEVIDNLVIGGVDDLDGIGMTPSADQCLLLIDASASDVAQSNLGTWIDRAERGGLHTRPTVRQRTPWYRLPPPPVPDLIIPKEQHERRLVAMNPAHAFVSDGCIGVTLHNPQAADRLALWMNSTVGLFLNSLFMAVQHKADMTVRDAEAFPVPTDEVLRDIQLRRHRPFLTRRIERFEVEYGAACPDDFRMDAVRRDRRIVDQHLMENIIGLTPEEQRWMYRLLLLWRMRGDNVRLLVDALVHDLETRHRLEPLSQWYTPLLEQLPDENTRVVILPQGVTRADITRTMFAWNVVCRKGSKADEVIECSTQEEAQIIKAMIDLGKVHVAIPTDAPIIADIVPRLDMFKATLETALDTICEVLPATDVATTVRAALQARMTAL
ncbi:MAG: hypothetical protein FGM24_03670 [Candidatus Kapabacteria bacterium]|nr:hypothetical protein [Candidatus Kapabacteria bacterium]